MSKTIASQSAGAPFIYDPDYTVAPGESLRSTLQHLGMTQAEFAQRAGLSLKHVNQIALGVAPITHETAFAFEKVTAVPARVWNGLEANYRDRLVRAEDKNVLTADTVWLKTLPIPELKRRRLVPDTNDPGVLLGSVCRFFGVANRQAWETVWRVPLASFRKSKSFKSDPGAAATWLRIGELKAAEIECKPYDPKSFREVLQTIRGLTTALPEEFEPELVRRCSEVGVAVVFVPEVKGSRASGATRWVTPTKAVMQLSLRHKSDDHLWFSFFHEAGHLLLHGKKGTFVTEGQAEDLAEEEANEFAETYLIPKRYESFLPQLKSSEAIRAFAQELGIAPGIVVGRLQKNDILDWNQQNQLKRRFVFIQE
jgi:HTH-type transcriptional regulator/antitoxin HigA